MQKSISIHLTAFFAFFLPALTFAQQTVGLFTKNNGGQDGFVLFSPNSSDVTYLIDKCGKLVNKWNTHNDPGLDAFILPNGNLLSTGKVQNPYFNSVGSAGGQLQIYDWNQKLLWSYTISDSITHQDHDVYPMPNGNILVCEWERITNAEAIAAGRDSTKLAGSNIWSAKIQEIKPIGADSAEIVWQWRLWDHLVQDKDALKPNFGIIADHPELLNVNYVDSTEANAVLGDSDWIHANSVAYNPDLDQVVISSRSLSEFWIIDHSTTTDEAATHNGGNQGHGGDILYRWGNPEAYNRASSGKRTLYLQHDVTWIPDGLQGSGHITVFNNGTGRPGGNFSSAEEIELPVDESGAYAISGNNSYGPDSSFWTYKEPKPTNFYSATEGSVQRLKNGNTMICEADSGIFIELDPNKNIVWRYVNPDGGYGPVSQGDTPKNKACFRAELYMENDPAFQNITLKPGNPIELNPLSYDCYMSYVVKGYPIYPITKVKTYNSTNGIDDSLNTYCYLKGIVQSNNLSIGNNEQYVLQDSTGGISISSTLFLDGYNPSVGDSIIVRGIVKQSNGLTYFSIDSVSMLTTETQISPITVSQLDENSESKLVILKGFMLNNLNKWDTTGAKGSFMVKAHNNSGDTIDINILSSTNLYLNAAKPSGFFDIIGIGSQFDSTKPYLTGYYIIPRSVQDIEESSSLTPQNLNSNDVSIYPNPTSGTLNIAANELITEVQITDMIGKIIFTQFFEKSNIISLNLNNLNPDIYYIKVLCGENSRIEKIVRF